MPDSLSSLLERRFWPNPQRRDIWMIVDCARDSAIFGQLLGSYLEYCCLYSGKIPASLEAASPYLLRLEANDRRSRNFLERAWGNSWGIFLKCDLHVQTLRRHLRRLLTVRDAGGRKLLFRYYDPRVLRVYLPTCYPSELRAFFGPIERIWMEGFGAEQIVEFGYDGAALIHQASALEAPILHPALNAAFDAAAADSRRPAPLAIRKEQFAVLSQTETNKFEDWMVIHLNKFFQRQCNSLGESKLRATIQTGIQRAAGHGITAKRDVCKFIDIMMALGLNFDSDAQYPWASAILSQPEPPCARAQALLSAAVSHLRTTAAPAETMKGVYHHAS